SFNTNAGRGARAASISGKSNSLGNIGTSAIHVCVKDLLSKKSFQVDMNPTHTAHLILPSSPAMNTVRQPPPERPPQPMRLGSTSSRAERMSSAFLSSAKNTAGQVVPAQNNDFAIICSCSPAHWL